MQTIFLADEQGNRLFLLQVSVVEKYKTYFVFLFQVPGIQVPSGFHKVTRNL